MLKSTILVMFLFCSSLSAMELDDKGLESILTQSAAVFDAVSFSLVKFPKNNQGEYIFSFCLSENHHWGIAPFGKPTGYRVDEEHQKLEVINCGINISPEELMNLSMQIFKMNQQKETQWSVKRHRPCYSKKAKSDTISICHDLFICPDCQADNYYWYNYLYFGLKLSFSAVFILESFVLGVLIYAEIYLSHAFTKCPSCKRQWKYR